MTMAVVGIVVTTTSMNDDDTLLLMLIVIQSLPEMKTYSEKKKSLPET